MGLLTQSFLHAHTHDPCSQRRRRRGQNEEVESTARDLDEGTIAEGCEQDDQYKSTDHHAGQRVQHPLADEDDTTDVYPFLLTQCVNGAFGSGGALLRSFLAIRWQLRVWVQAARRLSAACLARCRARRSTSRMVSTSAAGTVSQSSTTSLFTS